MRASTTAELIFENCVVPENIVGMPGESKIHLMRNLEHERVALAAMSVGIAKMPRRHELLRLKGIRKSGTSARFRGISVSLGPNTEQCEHMYDTARQGCQRLARGWTHAETLRYY